MNLKTIDSKCNRELNSPGARLLSVSLTFLFLFMTTIPRFAQDSPPEPDIFSMEQAEALVAEGLAAEALKILEKLKPETETPEQQIKFYLLEIRAFLALKDKKSAENTVREIYKKDLIGLIHMEELDEEIKFLFDKVQPEYWFALKDEKQDEEQFDRLVIQQYKKKPKKKRLISTLILGAVLIGAVVGFILFFTSKKGQEEDKGNLGTLKFENSTYGDVTIEIYGIVKIAPGTRHNTHLNPPVNFAYVDLPPGTHTLTVTSTSSYNNETEVFVYSIEIITGLVTHFFFYPM